MLAPTGRHYAGAWEIATFLPDPPVRKPSSDYFEGIPASRVYSTLGRVQKKKPGKLPARAGS